jgi:hypothetical protein
MGQLRAGEEHAGSDVDLMLIVLGNHPKPAIDNHFKTGQWEPA